MAGVDIMNDDSKITLDQCFCESINNKELIKEYDRLNGTNLSFTGSDLDNMIDKSCGRQDKEIIEFAEFVKTCIYEPLVLNGLATPLS